MPNLLAHYRAQGIIPYSRNDETYPFLVIAASPTDTPETLLGSAPTDWVTPEYLAFYDADHIEQVRANGARLYNGVCYAFDRLTLNPLRMHARVGYYYDHIATCVALEAELQRDEWPHREALHAHTPPHDLFYSGVGRCAVIGVNVLIVYNTPSGYQALVTRRSMQTAHKPGTFHVIPAFAFQPTSPEHPSQGWNLRDQVRREYAEELFGATELEEGGTDLDTHPAVQVLDALLASGGAELQLTGMTLNLQTTHVSVCMLLLIHDLGWQDQLAASITSWESVERVSLPIQQEHDMLRALPGKPADIFAANGAAALWLGVDAARQSLYSTFGGK
ncbi:MAG: hypothetical protein ACOYL5_06400 [Phototrophicaceae bacterium]|jgi:hypothetical protein